jgi:hypothetical protein
MEAVIAKSGGNGLCKTSTYQVQDAANSSDLMIYSTTLRKYTVIFLLGMQKMYDILMFRC